MRWEDGRSRHGAVAAVLVTVATLIGAGPAAAGAFRAGGQRSDAATLSDPAPIDLVLAVDISYALGAWPVHEAVTVLLDSLHADSCVVLMPFAANGVEAIRGRPDDATLRGRLVDERFRHYGALADGLDAALTVATADLSADASADGIAITGDACTVGQDDRDVTGTRRAIVLMTAGSNVPDEESMARLTERARDVGVPIFALVTYYQASAGTLETRGRGSPFPALRALEALVAPTGGRVLRARHDPEDNYRTIWNGLQELIGAVRDFATHDAT